MSKPVAKAEAAPSTTSYSVARKDGGYCITKHTLQGSRVVSSERVSEPDVLVICMANLERLVRREHGL